MTFEWDEAKNKINQAKHGISFEGICIVSHCYRGADDRIPIISARAATQKEKNVYIEQF